MSLKLKRTNSDSPFPYDKIIPISNTEIMEIAKEYALHWAKVEEKPFKAAEVFKKKYEEMVNKLLQKIPVSK